MWSEGEERIRVFLAKPGLDGHDRGVLVVGQALREAGMEVIYSGLKQTPEQVAEAAIQEDVDVLGISLLSGAHMALVPRIMELMSEGGADDITVLVGGVIPHQDAKVLEEEYGVGSVFGPGSDTRQIVEFIRNARGAKR
jgi:methylmalonyl-CoA mutase, C-terminal domain